MFKANSQDMENFGRPAKLVVDPKTNEAYIADGYGNKRVAVIDADTGKMKRYWGAYGNKPEDGPNPLGLLVCQSPNDKALTIHDVSIESSQNLSQQGLHALGPHGTVFSAIA